MSEKPVDLDSNLKKEPIDPEIQRRIDKGLHIPKQVAENPEYYTVHDDIRGVYYQLKDKYAKHFTKLKNPLGFLKSGKK